MPARRYTGTFAQHVAHNYMGDRPIWYAGRHLGHKSRMRVDTVTIGQRRPEIPDMDETWGFC